MKAKESEKAGLKFKVQKTKIMVSDPITSWQIDGETMETVTNFIFLGSRIIADSDYSHESKRCLLARWEKKAMTNLDRVFKSISSSVLSFLYGPTLTSIHDYWKNHSFD